MNEDEVYLPKCMHTCESCNVKSCDYMGHKAILREFDLDMLMAKYGPDGCYELAQALLMKVNDDVDTAKSQLSIPFGDGFRDA